MVTDDGKVMIVDEFTGRLLPGRRYSDGLHQAIEAKEGVNIERDTQTLATITLQNYFRLYKKLAGMTGTAETEAAEFFDIYKLDVVVVPTNQPMVRDDQDDLVYKTKREKYNAVIEEIEDMREINRPVLVGTTSVEVSETTQPDAQARRDAAQRAERQAAPAGGGDRRPRRAPRARSRSPRTWRAAAPTSSSGRGWPTRAGSTSSARNATKRAVSTASCAAAPAGRATRARRSSYLSLEDDLMRLFGSDRIAGIMERLGLKEGEVIQHPMITRSVERAQKKVEENNFGDPEAAAGIRQRHEPAARGHLRAGAGTRSSASGSARTSWG